MASAPITHPLPEDIVVDILARLPVKSLKRFRCVGKSWCSLIQNPRFISTHYSFSKKKTYSVVLHWQYDFALELKEVVSIISNQTLDLDANLDMPSFADKKTSAHIGGFCNGIICLSYYESDIVLWNIATKEFKTLPTCPSEAPPGFYNCTEVVCLGYDSKKDDYKVIRIDTFWNLHFRYEDPRAMCGKRVALYNLSTDSWRKLNANLTDVEIQGYEFPESQFYSNGFFHCSALIEDEQVLLSFDMSSEVFVTTPLPDGVEYSTFCFMEIDGSVGGISHDYSWFHFKGFDLWALGEVGVKNSWIKLFRISPSILNMETMAFDVSSDGKVTFKERGNEYFMVWLYPSNRKIKTPQTSGRYLEVVMYSESLVSLRGGSAYNN
ncbi:hypothetical protein DITRI_Ditri16bG0115400 [Diplodiscus trichospermus]